MTRPLRDSRTHRRTHRGLELRGTSAALPRLADSSRPATLTPLQPSLKLQAGSAFTASILAVRLPGTSNQPSWPRRSLAPISSLVSPGWHRDRNELASLAAPKATTPATGHFPSFQPIDDSVATPFSPHNPTSAGSYSTEPHSDQLGHYSRRKRLHRRHFVSISHQRPQRGPSSTPSGPFHLSPGQTIDS